MKNKKKNNVIDFPTSPSKLERQVEAILFAAAEPLDIETIEKRVQTTTNLNMLNNPDSEYMNLIENAFQHLENFKQTYLNSSIAHKQKLISSIFPEKIDFDGKKCRTIRINDFLRYILQIDKELPESKKGQISKNMSLSRLVESEGIEPSSKQVIQLLSTSLVYA